MHGSRSMITRPKAGRHNRDAHDQCCNCHDKRLLSCPCLPTTTIVTVWFIGLFQHVIHDLKYVCYSRPVIFCHCLFWIKYQLQSSSHLAAPERRFQGALKTQHLRTRPRLTCSRYCSMASYCYLWLFSSPHSCVPSPFGDEPMQDLPWTRLDMQMT
jgi:hypothetical protein